MSFSISGLFQKVQGALQKMDRKKRIILLAVMVAITAVAVILALILGKNSFTVLYRGLPAAEGAEVMELLDGLGAEYKIGHDGTIYVPSDREAIVKMQLASEGYPKSALTYDIFAGGSAIISTDYEKRQYLIFQLQNRLQDAIKTLNGIQSAIVTLNVADDSSFVLKSDQTESSASVVLDMGHGVSLTKKQVRGIESLVGKSVSGLSAANVVILDGSGNILNEQEDKGDGFTLSRLEMVNDINKLYEQKIKTLLEPMLGKNGVSVLVNVVVDFRQKTSEETTYTPVVGESGIISRHEYQNSNTNGGAVPGGVTGTETNTGVPTYQEGDGPDNGDQSASASGSTDYLVNKMIQTILDSGGAVSDMTVAVVINQKELPGETKAEYQRLIAFGTGISTEKVAITNAAFLAEGQVPGTNGPEGSSGTSLGKALAELLGLEERILFLIGIGAAFVLLMVLWIVHAVTSKKKKRRRVMLAESAERMAELRGTPENLPGDIVLNETREQGLKKQIRNFSSTNPEIVAQLLRAWMKEGDPR